MNRSLDLSPTKFTRTRVREDHRGHIARAARRLRGTNAFWIGALALCSTMASAAPPSGTSFTVDSLSAPRKALASATDGQRIFFAGGRVDTTRSDVVDMFDSATHSWSTFTLSEARSELVATCVGSYVLIAGGASSPFSASAKVDVLDTTTMTWTTASLSQARSILAATTVGQKAIFAGGSSGGPMAPIPSDVVDIYDASVGPPSDPLAWSTTTLSVPRGQIGATTVGTYALFAGGISGHGPRDVVDIYDDATGLWSTATLSQARSLEVHSAATASGRAYFAGGVTDPSPTAQFSDRVDVYDSAVGPPSDPLAWSTLTLSLGRVSLAAVALGDTVYFAGGIIYDPVTGQGATDVVDVLQASTGTWDPVEHLSVGRLNLAGEATDHHLLFGGGDSWPTVVATVDALELPSAYPPAEVSRMGTPPNPDVLKPGLTSGPVLGATWDPYIDHTTFVTGALVDVLAVGQVPGPFNLPTSLGTLLVDLSLPPIWFLASPGAPFVCSIPNDPAFLGLMFGTQGASADGVTVVLTNALDITIGAH